MNKFYLFLILIFIGGLQIQAQTLDSRFYDGKIYLRPHKNVQELNSEGKKVDLKLASFLSKDLIANFGIQTISKPFYRTTEKEIRSIYLVEFSQINKVNDLLKILNAQSNIDYAEQVPIHKVTLTPNDLGANSTSGTGQWHLHKVQAPLAWDISVGNPNIKVAIVDDAVLSNHPDLAPALWVNSGEIPNNGIDDDGNGYIDDINGFDVADDDPDVMPNTSSMSHGTHVAGIAGAKTNNGVGVASIGFGVSIMAVKSSNQAQVVTDAYAGITYAADAGADVINMSWGGSGGGNTGQNIINYAYNKGCVLVAASGNDNVTTQFYPAAYNNVISVSSTTNTDAKSSFSNYGTWIDISAPGSAIYSTYVGTNFTSTYSRIQGTSMASPFVAGMVGLMLSLNPNLTFAQITNCLYSTADPVTTNSGQMGAGRFNAYEAMLCVQSYTQAAPVGQINASETLLCSGTPVQFNGSSIGGQATTFAWSFPGGTPATSSLPNPQVVYNANGTYNVTLIVSNQFGSDTVSMPNYITISNQGVQTIYSENFEGTTINMTTSNPDNAITWDVVSTGGLPAGTQSARMNFYNYQATGQRDGLITPSLSFATNNDVTLSFNHAYRRYNQTGSDSLIIYASTNNGTTWNRIWARGENGTGNFATAATSQNAFTPTQASQWCIDPTVGAPCFTIDLGAYNGAASVRLKFEGFNNYGNNLYLDNIVITGKCLAPQAPSLPTPSFNAAKPTICEGNQVAFTNTTAGSGNTYLWTFVGGTPATSTLANPTVTYNTPGTYNVSLQASNAGGSNTATQTSYVTVHANPVASIINNAGVLTASPSGMSYQWFLNGNAISGAQQQSYTPSSNGSYHVVVTNPNSCVGTSSTTDIFGLSYEDLSAFEFNMYPNPTSQILHINWSNIDVEKLEIMDMYGRVIKTQKISNESSQTVDCSGLAEGVYFLKLNSKNRDIAIKKFVVKH